MINRRRTVKESPYITWAKSRREVRLNLSRAGVGPLDLESWAPPWNEMSINADNADGWSPLLERVARRYQVDSSQVVTTHGASMANHLVTAALLNPADRVLLERPYYEPLLSVCAFQGAEIDFFDRETEPGQEWDVSRIEEQLKPSTRLLILSNLHNPTGQLLDRSRLDEIAGLAENHGFHVLVDESFLEFFHDQGQQTCAGLSPRMIATGSLSKAYGVVGLRLGWILSHPILARRIRDLNDLYSPTTAHPSERLGSWIIDRSEAILGGIRNDLDRNRWRVDDFVKARPELKWNKPPGGTIGWIRYEPGNTDDLIRRLETQYDTTLAPGRFFGDDGCFRLGFGLPRKDLEEALGNLDEVLE